MKHVQTEIEIEIILNIWQNVTYESRKRLTKWFENMEKLKLFDKMWPTEVVRGSQMIWKFEKNEIIDWKIDKIESWKLLKNWTLIENI